jgi:hypothetical protein
MPHNPLAITHAVEVPFDLSDSTVVGIDLAELDATM